MSGYPNGDEPHDKQHPLDTEELAVVEITLALKIPTSLAATLALLLREKFVTRDDIEHKYRTAANAKVTIHRIRDALEGKKVEPKIQVMRGIGYWIEPEDKVLLTQKIKELAP